MIWLAVAVPLGILAAAGRVLRQRARREDELHQQGHNPDAGVWALGEAPMFPHHRLGRLTTRPTRPWRKG